MNDDERPPDPNQVFCVCGRLLRVIPVVVGRATVTDCRFTVTDPDCPWCRGTGRRPDEGPGEG